jgi:hypothetical protein
MKKRRKRCTPATHGNTTSLKSSLARGPQGCGDPRVCWLVDDSSERQFPWHPELPGLKGVSPERLLLSTSAPPSDTNADKTSQV